MGTGSMQALGQWLMGRIQQVGVIESEAAVGDAVTKRAHDARLADGGHTDK
jgi:hypothetical protein